MTDIWLVIVVASPEIAKPQVPVRLPKSLGTVLQADNLLVPV